MAPSIVYYETHNEMCAVINPYHATHLLERYCKVSDVSSDTFDLVHVSRFLMWLSREMIDDAPRYERLALKLMAFVRRLERDANY